MAKIPKPLKILLALIAGLIMLTLAPKNRAPKQFKNTRYVFRQAIGPCGAGLMCDTNSYFKGLTLAPLARTLVDLGKLRDLVCVFEMCVRI